MNFSLTQTAHAPTLTACRICGGTGLASIEAREMMFGLRERFEYAQCNSCGCLQIAEYLGNLEKYYPSNYYSFSEDSPAHGAPGHSAAHRIMRAVKMRIINLSRWNRARFLNMQATRQWLKSRPTLALYVKHVADPRKRILDVGCGSGALLKSLYYLYYENLMGCDPFIDRDQYYFGRPLVRKSFLIDMTEKYDVVSMHHVLEHMPNQLEIMKQARECLTADGIIMVRVPVVGGEAWRTYRENWVQLDPPRHYYIHSEDSFRLLATQAGLEVVSIEYDSAGFQFWGSEMYVRDIPLMGERESKNSGKPVFSPEELAGYELRAAAANGRNDGDQFAAILRPRREPALT